MLMANHFRCPPESQPTARAPWQADSHCFFLVTHTKGLPVGQTGWFWVVSDTKPPASARMSRVIDQWYLTTPRNSPRLSLTGAIEASEAHGPLRWIQSRAFSFGISPLRSRIKRQVLRRGPSTESTRPFLLLSIFPTSGLLHATGAALWMTAILQPEKSSASFSIKIFTTTALITQAFAWSLGWYSFSPHPPPSVNFINYLILYTFSHSVISFLYIIINIYINGGCGPSLRVAAQIRKIGIAVRNGSKALSAPGYKARLVPHFRAPRSWGALGGEAASVCLGSLAVFRVFVSSFSVFSNGSARPNPLGPTNGAAVLVMNADGAFRIGPSLPAVRAVPRGTHRCSFRIDLEAPSIHFAKRMAPSHCLMAGPPRALRYAWMERG